MPTRDEMVVALELQGLREYETGMGAAVKSTASLKEETRRLAYNTAFLGRGFSQVGHTMTRWVTLPILAAGAASLKFYSDFNDAMDQVQTQAGASGKEVTRYSKAIQDYTEAGKSIHTNVDLAHAMYRVRSEGITGTKAIKTMYAADKLATTGRADLEQTTFALVAAQKALHTPTRGINKLAAEMNSIIGASNIRMDDLVGALGTGVLPVMKGAGLGIKDFGAVLATATSQGMSATRTMTQFQTGLKNIEAPSKQAQDVLHSLGLGKLDLARTLERKGTLAFIQQLKGSLEGVGKVQQRADLSQLLGGSRGLRIWTVLMRNSDYFANRTQVIAKNTAKYNEEARKAAGTPAARLHRLWSEIHSYLTDIGASLMPSFLFAVKELAKFTGGIAHWFSGLSTAGKIAVEVGLALAAAAGPALVIIGSFLRLYATWKLIKAMRMGPSMSANMAEAGASVDRLTAQVGVLNEALGSSVGESRILAGSLGAAPAEGGAVGAAGAGRMGMVGMAGRGMMGLLTPALIGAYIGYKLGGGDKGLTAPGHVLAKTLRGSPFMLETGDSGLQYSYYHAGLTGEPLGKLGGHGAARLRQLYEMGTKRREYEMLAHGYRGKFEALELHTHVYLNNRQIAEAVSEYTHDKKARR